MDFEKDLSTTSPVQNNAQKLPIEYQQVIGILLTVFMFPLGLQRVLLPKLGRSLIFIILSLAFVACLLISLFFLSKWEMTPYQIFATLKWIFAVVTLILVIKDLYKIYHKSF